MKPMEMNDDQFARWQEREFRRLQPINERMKGAILGYLSQHNGEAERDELKQAVATTDDERYVFDMALETLDDWRIVDFTNEYRTVRCQSIQRYQHEHRARRIAWRMRQAAIRNLADLEPRGGIQ